MNVIWYVLFFIVLGAGLGWLIGNYIWRLFPMYKKGTVVFVQMGGPDSSDVIRCRYHYRRTSGHHRVEVLPGDDLGWDGRFLTPKTEDIRREELP